MIDTDHQMIGVRKQTHLDTFNDLLFGEMRYILTDRFKKLGTMNREELEKDLEQISNYYRDKYG